MGTTLQAAWRPEDIFTPDNIKAEYRTLAKQFHPDLYGSDLLFKKLNRLHELALEKLKASTWGELTFSTATSCLDTGPFWKHPGESTYYITGTRDQLDKNLEVYNKLTKSSDGVINRYLPVSVQAGNTVHHKGTHLSQVIKVTDGATRLSGPVLMNLRPLEDVHVAWICSRLLEFLMLSHVRGFCNLSITPDNVFIHPETHGVTVFTQFHTTPTNDLIKTISAKWKDFYPRSIFGHKKAIPAIDLAMVKHLAAWLLGDELGGANLPNVPKPFANWITSQEDSVIDTYPQYRKMLEQAFGKPKFVKMNLKQGK